MNPQISKETKVLVVDDQVLAKGYMKYSLEELGFNNITYVDRAQHALNKIRHEHYDLIICSYNLKKDHDGYHLYDQLKHNGELEPSTAFIFISADTTSDLVHSIVELQPDDFLAKPFTVNDLDRRLTKVLVRKRALKKVYRFMGKGQLSKALAEVELFLSEPKNAEFFPLALKTKGELLLACGHFEQAKEFYQAIINVQSFTWAQLGLVNAHIRLNEDDDAEKLVLELAFKSDSQLAAYDLLSALHIKQKDFDVALECVVMATEISPRNIRRHKTALDLSRITHDYETQFDAAKKIVRFAKDSIHDKPENYLNVARAGIDFAMTADESETYNLLKQANEYVKQFKSAFPKAELHDQIKVIDARLLYLQDEKENAKALLDQLAEENWELESMDALLDKAKAFHELGLYEKSSNIMDVIEQRCKKDEKQGSLFLHYVRQEKLERSTIKQTPKELNNSAVAFYRRGDLEDALRVFRQAFTVMPKNIAIALNLLQAITMNENTNKADLSIQKLIDNCIRVIENGELNDEQFERYQKVREMLHESA
ncbi:MULTISPECIES: tetratricopeptide repeat-containing response regulator [Aliiglaciecola]|uniref:tetratricopeptide repeat-containing response regulator n=1 Tax=Aliiglaciecola TaxID=1406885 RepID=UPI001C094303|nr:MULTISPECIES: tetratricopeptide repeat-containing response regulator [Aliiglaciecola]MBU2877127.1 response regulator [Aliiglaciecola lipolytica]MDO6710154.1 response regulator [Aliiglaciecola sp. 2_MG-2023]MDO6751302.1 response regulator [Aliiglaciecola sp. 1_MG-2023]